MRARRVLWIGLALAVTAAACSSDNDVTAGSSVTVAQTTVPGATVPASTIELAAPSTAPAAELVVPFEPTPIEWEQLDDSIDVATLEVPVDYADPDGPRFELFLTRYNALDQDNKIGTLLVNPGGPGYGGTDLAVGAAQRYSRSLRDRFDIVGWDPRGTGESTPPIDCIDDYDTYFTAVDSTPDDQVGRDAVVELAERFADECVAKNAEILGHVGTNDSARDIDSIRRALGEDEISYFGFSYGSELGGVWATMFPDTVRAAVFDGASDPNASDITSSLQQLSGFEDSLDAFLADCSGVTVVVELAVVVAAAAFDAVMAELDANPLVVEAERPLVNRDVATTAVVMAMYSDAYWPSLAASLAAAQEGDGSGLLALHDSYYGRTGDGTWGNQLEAFRAISCADQRERPTVEEVDARAPELHSVAPRLVPESSVGGYTCTFFPPATDPRIAISGAGAGPILVIGTTRDPSTPLASTRAMAAALEDARLVVVDANQHTGYGVNTCVIDLVDDYLIDLAVPAGETECG